MKKKLKGFGFEVHKVQMGSDIISLGLRLAGAPITIGARNEKLWLAENAAMALVEKCRRIASWAKMMPAMGALKPAEIAAATPQPIKISV